MPYLIAAQGVPPTLGMPRGRTGAWGEPQRAARDEQCPPSDLDSPPQCRAPFTAAGPLESPRPSPRRRARKGGLGTWKGPGAGAHCR